MTDTGGSKKSKRTVSVRGERVAAVVTGGALALYGLRRRSIGGAVLGLVGSALAYHGATSPAGLLGIGGTATRSRTVACSPDEAYRFLRDVQNFPRLVDRVESVTALSDTRSQWLFRRSGKRFGWTVASEAEIVIDTPGELLVWRFEQDGGWRAASASFQRAPGERGTQVRLAVEGERASEVEEGLRRLKQIIETGEIATTEGQPTGDTS